MFTNRIASLEIMLIGILTTVAVGALLILYSMPREIAMKLKWPTMTPLEMDKELGGQQAITMFGAQTPAIRALSSLIGPESPDSFSEVVVVPLRVKEVISSGNDQDAELPSSLKGQWFVPNHPTFGPLLWRFHSSSSFKGSVVNIHGEQQFSYANVVTGNYSHAGSVIVADNHRNRRWLQFFFRYGLEYGFPLFSKTSLGEVTAGLRTHLDTWVLTKMREPFTHFLLPSGYLEGFSVEDFMHSGFNGTVWDPLAADDISMCSCSLRFFPDIIERRQFGHFSYNMYRISDGTQKTSWFSHFNASLSNTEFVQIDPLQLRK